MMKKLVGISLAMVMLLGSVPLGFSEPLRVQLEQGLEADQIQCNNPNHILVTRTSGELACVSEKSAEKMNWEKYEHPLSDIEFLLEQKEYLLQKIEEAKQDIIDYQQYDDEIRVEMDGLWDIYGDIWNTKREMTYDRLRDELHDAQKNQRNAGYAIREYNVDIVKATMQIYNLENPDKTPLIVIFDIIDNEKEFVKLFTKAVNDRLTGEIDDDGRYITEYGKLKINENSAYYDMNTSLLDDREREKFTDNFMDVMGFEYDEKDKRISSNVMDTWIELYNLFSTSP